MKAERGTLHFLCRLVLGTLSLALIFATLIPFHRGDAWWIRIFEFPRIQIAVLMAMALGGYVALRCFRPMRRWEHLHAALLGLGLIWQLVSIAPYTRLYPKEMAPSQAENDAERISILIFNVLAENREVEALRTLIRDSDPDVILLSETTQWWLDQLEGLDADYPYTLFQPQENNYGLLLYSRLELEEPEVRFLVEAEIPSMRTRVRLRSGTVVTLYGVHPRPPGIHRPEEEEGTREDAKMRNAELLSVAKEVKRLGEVPVIVAGDFNDVAWSRSTRLFQRMGGLRDPRVGRGFINTFDTRSRLMRFPLDHVFATRHFLLVELRRLPDIGSDHFPVLVILDYSSEAAFKEDAPQPDAADKKEADEAIRKGKSNDCVSPH